MNRAVTGKPAGPQPAKRMNSIIGKEILALARGCDYAHPGEEEAIEMAMAPVARNSARRLLDVGCGRGGTAHYIASRGWGSVTGVDIDRKNIDYALQTYRDLEFVCCDVANLASAWPQRADVIFLFTAFYAFPDQETALQQMRSVAAGGAQLVLFDYTWRRRDPRAKTFASRTEGTWNPVEPDRFPEQLKRTGWHLEQIDDLSAEFGKWYLELNSRIRQKREAIVAHAGEDWYRFARDWYEELGNAFFEDLLGGAVFYARTAG